MNNDFYYSDNQNNEVKYSSSQKNLLLVFTAIVLIAVGYISMTSGIFDKVNGIETTTERKIVYVGEEETIKVKSKTNGNFNPAVKFKSKKNNFTLSEDIQYGEEVETKIIGSKVGSDTLVIYAGKDVSKKEKSKEVEVIVCDKPEITNTGDKTLNIKENTSVQLSFNVADECLKGYEIEIENDSVASIDSNYNLTAKKVGTTSLVLKRNGDRIKYKINVKPTTVAVKSVKVNTKSFNLAIGKTKKLSISVLPSDATNRKVTYKSSDENIATVSSNGTVKGISVGTATITVTSASDSSKSGRVKVKVYKQELVVTSNASTVSVTSIKFDSSSYKIAYNETKKLVLGVTPTNASNKAITCKSLNTTIVTASSSGNTCTIKGIKPGTTTIEAYSVDGNKQATASVTVNPIAVTSIAFEQASYAVNAGASATAVVKFTPSNASNQTLTCSTSDSSIATVSAKGASCVVSGVKAGSVTITATSQDGNKTAKTTVKVNTVLVTGVSFATSSYNIDEGNTVTLTPTISPSNATNKGYTCSSNNTGVATITSGCTVKGVSAGTATITVTTSDGGKTSTATVTVKKAVNKVTVTFATFNVGYFACGSYSGASCRPTTTDMVNLIKKYGIDVVGMQEARDTSKNTDSNASCPYTTYKVNSIKNGLGYNGRIVCPGNVDAILSKYKFESSKVYSLGGGRDLTKVVVKINGVDISFYNSHLGLKDDNETHFKKIADIVKSDPNPIIITADWNYTALARFKTYFLDPDDMKFTMAGYDTTSHNMWGKASYCDAILVKSKGHIDIVSSQTVDTYNSYSDHNMVIAKLAIY